MRRRLHGVPGHGGKLPKKGGPEDPPAALQRALQARRSPVWEPYSVALRQRGLRTTAAFVALGRKLARVCFTLLKKGTEFNPELRARGGASAWKLYSVYGYA